MAMHKGPTAALVSMPSQHRRDTSIALSVDTLVEGTHFFGDVSAESLGHKCAAVNLSDMAAMGATPAWLCLYVQQPQSDSTWLDNFTRGAKGLTTQCNARLDIRTEYGSQLRISGQVGGYVPSAHAITRDGARPGDQIIVTGTLGDAGGALKLRYDDKYLAKHLDHIALNARLERPQPRNQFAIAIRDNVSAGLDLSDGLAGDLQHILGTTLGAKINAAALPTSAALARVYPNGADRIRLALTSGDDYELCLTLAPTAVARARAVGAECGLDVTVVGEIVASPGINVANAPALQQTLSGYQHFNS